MIVYKPLQHIRAITFDLDDTLYNNMPYIYEAEHALKVFMAERYPLTQSLTADDWRRIRKSVAKEQPSLANDVGHFRSAVMTKGFIQAGMQSDEIPQAVSDCFDYFYFKRSDFTVSKGTRKILKKLSKRLPIAAITNGNVDCQAIGISKYFTHIEHASVNYPMKPNPAMFVKVAKLLGIPPANILHVGDDLDKDIRGAVDAGYQSAWLAVNRKMNLTKEEVTILPHIQLDNLAELKKLSKVRKRDGKQKSLT